MAWTSTLRGFASDLVHPFNRPTPAFPIGVKAASWRSPTYRALRAHWLSEMLLRRGKPASDGPRTDQSEPKSKPNWPTHSPVKLFGCKAPQNLQRLKHPAPVLPLVGRTHCSPFTSPPPRGPFISHNNGPHWNRFKTSCR